jgi:hypothetical protein
MVFCFVQRKKFGQNEFEYLFFLSRKVRIFFPEFNIRLYESCDKIKVAVSQIFDRVKSVGLRAIRTKRGYWLLVNGGQGWSIENVSSRKFQI